MNISRYLKNIDSLIAAIIGFYVIYLYTKYSGVGISPDSVMYASTATNIQAHGTLLTFNKTPITFFPVFYPFFLGVIQFFSRIDPITAGAVINQFLFAAVIFTSGWIMSKFLSHSIIYKWLILAAIILSPGLLEIYTFLWSETLFTLEILFFIIAYAHYLKTRSIKSLVWVGVISAISCITRYAGVTIIGTGCLMLLLDNQLILKKRVLYIFLYGCISISLLVANLVLNRLSTGLSTGTREPSITPFFQNLYYCGTVFCDWGSLSKATYPFAALITSIILLALIGILIFKTIKGQINRYENVVIAFALVYGLFIVISASISRYERINSRLLSPMFIPLLIACTSWVPDVLKLIQAKAARYVLSGVAVILMLAFEYASYQTDWQRYDDESDYGVPGYSDDSWNKSEFVVYLKQHKNLFKPGVPIYTDANEAVYLFTGMSSELLPHKFFKADVQKFYANKHFYLIWFDNLYNTELVGLPDILKNKKLTKIGAAKEGEIYLCDEK
ncbi:hypothetical protein JN11_03485 [Mucilaginibacter frigoritolerans]|uniref:Dolichyl-phosphate-mannose-protein mannosyltransferase n=1 Tax=Mucilaginibacter frigoritolerans TaxID=652788 RepID=A0A562TVQ3_9SPHI|nr:hypothetical protein [Mucilaginibacter frigoritolerans]TWI97662.1 hypothetical protein JN11_03485 [Mucilaginibacter frigoritolerans]